jgi:hypothetical protein
MPQPECGKQSCSSNAISNPRSVSKLKQLDHPDRESPAEGLRMSRAHWQWNSVTVVDDSVALYARQGVRRVRFESLNQLFNRATSSRGKSNKAASS